MLMNELHLQAAAGAGFSGERSVSFTAQEPAEILPFDLAWQNFITNAFSPRKREEEPNG
jgi:hypothetical protein